MPFCAQTYVYLGSVIPNQFFHSLSKANGADAGQQFAANLPRTMILNIRTRDAAGFSNRVWTSSSLPLSSTLATNEVMLDSERTPCSHSAREPQNDLGS